MYQLRFSFCLVLLGLGCVAAAGWYGMQYWNWIHRPLGRPEQVFIFPALEMSPSLTSYLLTDNFKVIREARQIPEPILTSFTEAGSARLLIVNPGEDFNVTDVIVDSSLPRRRLAIAGTSENVTFVHYEEGGFGKQYLLEVFENRPGDYRPAWSGSCDKLAQNLSDLRSEISAGHCRWDR